MATDDSEQITVNDLTRVLSQGPQGADVDPPQLQRMALAVLESLDMDGDGVVSFDDVRWHNNHP